MIHDKARVEAIRSRVAAQIALVKSLEARVVKGELDALHKTQEQFSKYGEIGIEIVGG